MFHRSKLPRADIIQAIPLSERLSIDRSRSKEIPILSGKDDRLVIGDLVPHGLTLRDRLQRGQRWRKSETPN